MHIREKLTEDMKAAMKNKDMQTLDAVRMLLASIQKKALDIGHDLEESEMVEVIVSDAKKLKDALESFVAAAREDLAQKVREELAIVQKYLPEQMSDEDLQKIVQEKISAMADGGAQAVGKLMGTLVNELRGKVDGSRIKAMVEKLSK
jgi:uncharacterized protein YqeY